jgi:tetratricopeptide (TPR) repeat protein
MSMAKAQMFFQKAVGASASGNYDYAIELFLDGLAAAPDALEEGHLKLYETALERQKKGGKKPSMIEKVKKLHTKKMGVEQMLEAEYLFAKDPGHLSFIEGMLKGAAAAGLKKSAKWMADLAFGLNNQMGEKASWKSYLLIKDSYAMIGEYERAMIACQQASKLRPEDLDLADELKRLAAELTFARGKYDRTNNFRDSIKDRQSQEQRQAELSSYKSKDLRKEMVAHARKQLAGDPGLPKNIFHLAQVLSEMRDSASTKEAIELLEDAYKSKGDYSFMVRAGQIQMKHLKRKLRAVKAAYNAKKGDPVLKKKLLETSKAIAAYELKYYKDLIDNYPTDLRAKYEYGVRLMNKRDFDGAIPMLQEAQREPMHRVNAMSKVGLCFFYKGWFSDAADIFRQAIDSREIKDDDTAKELRYNLARALEEQGKDSEALEIYRRIAQMDFGYKDVSARVDKLRGS